MKKTEKGPKYIYYIITDCTKVNDTYSYQKYIMNIET